MTVQAINGATPSASPAAVRFFPVRKCVIIPRHFFSRFLATVPVFVVRLPLIDIPVPCAFSLLRTHSLRGRRHHLRHSAESGLANSPKESADGGAWRTPHRQRHFGGERTARMEGSGREKGKTRKQFLPESIVAIDDQLDFVFLLIEILVSSR